MHTHIVHVCVSTTHGKIVLREHKTAMSNTLKAQWKTTIQMILIHQKPWSCSFGLWFICPEINNHSYLKVFPIPALFSMIDHGQQKQSHGMIRFPLGTASHVPVALRQWVTPHRRAERTVRHRNILNNQLPATGSARTGLPETLSKAGGLLWVIGDQMISLGTVEPACAQAISGCSSSPMSMYCGICPSLGGGHSLAFLSHSSVLEALCSACNSMVNLQFTCAKPGAQSPLQCHGCVTRHCLTVCAAAKHGRQHDAKKKANTTQKHGDRMVNGNELSLY